MPSTHAVIFAMLHGLTTVLPLSASGHELVARIWLDGAAQLKAIEAVATLSCLLALIVVLRGRLGQAFSEGIRGIARPAVLQSSEGGRDAVTLVLAALVGGTADVLLARFHSPLNEVPALAGAGLLLTALAITSTLLAPAPRAVCPGPTGSLLVGLAYGLAVMPGLSRIGAAFVVLRWLGIDSWRSAQLAMMIAVPLMALRSALWLLGGAALGDMGGGQVALVALVAFLAASLAVSWWRALCQRRRVATLGLWLVPLSLGLISYDRALPAPTVTPSPSWTGASAAATPPSPS